MYFPIPEINLAIGYLIAIGFTVGVCGGFWGMGGGWITTPALYALGVPMNLAVGTSLAQMTGQSVVSAFWHRKFGNISRRVALIMIPGTIVGVELGARILERFKTLGQARMDEVISLLYIILLTILTVYTIIESIHSARKLTKKRQLGEGQETSLEEGDQRAEDFVSVDLAARLSGLRIPPMVRPRKIRVGQMSVWIILVAAVSTGLLAGLLGVGGGFLRMPILVYVIGCPTHVAVGTDLAGIVVSGSFGAFTHALKGNVDLLIAVFMLLGAVGGAQLGSFATRYVRGTELRTLFGVGMAAATLSLVVKTYFHMPTLAAVLILGVAGLLAAIIIGLLIKGLLAQSRAVGT